MSSVVRVQLLSVVKKNVPLTELGCMSFHLANLVDGMDNFRGRNEFNLFLQLGHHLAQNHISDGMRMSDSDRLAMALGDSNQFFYLLADKIRFLEMIEKNVPLGKRNLKQACRWFTDRFN